MDINEAMVRYCMLESCAHITVQPHYCTHMIKNHWHTFNVDKPMFDSINLKHLLHSYDADDVAGDDATSDNRLILCVIMQCDNFLCDDKMDDVKQRTNKERIIEEKASFVCNNNIYYIVNQYSYLLETDIWFRIKTGERVCECLQFAQFYQAIIILLKHTAQNTQCINVVGRFFSLFVSQSFRFTWNWWAFDALLWLYRIVATHSLTQSSISSERIIQSTNYER